MIHSGAVGGGPRVLLDTVEVSSERGIVSTIACGVDGPLAEELRRRGFDVTELYRTGKLSFLLSLPRLVRTLKRTEIGAVFLYGQFAGFYGSIACKIARIPAIYEAQFPSFHTDAGPFSRVRNQLAEWVTCRLSAATVVLNESDRIEYVRRRLVESSHLRVIANGIRWTDPDPSSVDKIRKDLVGSGEVLLLAAGRMTHQKGFDVLLRAMPLILRHCPGVRLVLVGEGEQRSHLRSLILSLGLANHTVLVGFQSDLSPWIAAADIVAVPSRYEAGGLFAREAMAAGKPVVASAVQGLRDTIATERTGLLVPPDDPELLANALIRMLDDQNLADTLGRDARHEAQDSFTIDRMWQRYEYVLRDIGVLSRSSRAGV